jgi:hypothetical protein
MVGAPSFGGVSPSNVGVSSTAVVGWSPSSTCVGADSDGSERSNWTNSGGEGVVSSMLVSGGSVGGTSAKGLLESGLTEGAGVGNSPSGDDGG